MIVAVDVGNTRIKCAVADNNRVLGRESMETARYTDQTALGDMVRRVSGAVLSVDGAVVSSVVPAATMHVIRAVERGAGLRPRLVNHKARMPFALSVPVPGQIGTDRLCAAAGAVGLRRRNAIVIDAGSAITIDVVRDGAFRGGVIAAGPSLALKGLHQYASQLPLVDVDGVSTPFPPRFDRTEFAMTLGAFLGGIGAIRESVRFLEESVGKVGPKWITGGFGRLLSSRLPTSWTYDPDLTLKGLYVIATLNPAKSGDPR